MSGQVDVSEAFNMDDPQGRSLAMKAIEDSEEIRKRMSPPGALGLPPLLEKRRLEYGIMDDAFQYQAAFDRIIVWQISQFEGRTLGSGLIQLTDRGMERERQTAPRGIILSAGLQALDALRSHGMDLGHKISFLKLSPWRDRVAVIGGKEFYVMTMRAGDIVGSLDTAEMLRKGELTVANIGGENIEHVYQDEAGSFATAVAVEMDEAY